IPLFGEFTCQNVVMAERFIKAGRLQESNSYCESALRIYAKPVPGTTVEESAPGIMEISAIFEDVDEPELEDIGRLGALLRLL
ncbi:hypothetical protein IFM89_022056, partial [Coptis chinensis]